MLGLSAFFRDMLNISIEAGARDVASEHLLSNVLPARALLWAAVSGDLRAAMQLNLKFCLFLPPKLKQEQVSKEGSHTESEPLRDISSVHILAAR